MCVASILGRAIICVCMEASALPSELSFGFIHEMYGNVVDQRVDEHPCLLHPPIFPFFEIASTSCHKAEEKERRGDRSRAVTGSWLHSTRWTREAGHHDGDARPSPPPPLPPPPQPTGVGGTEDAPANNQVHTFPRYTVDCCRECRRVPVLGNVG